MNAARAGDPGARASSTPGARWDHALRWTLLTAPAALALLSAGVPRQAELLQACLIIAGLTTLGTANMTDFSGRALWSLATALLGARLAFFDAPAFLGLGTTVVIAAVAQAFGLAWMARDVRGWRALGLVLGLAGCAGLSLIALAPERIEGHRAYLALILAWDLAGPILALRAMGERS